MSKVRTGLGGLAAACGCILSLTAAARPAEKMDLPDWSKTPVEDRDLGHGVHMLESFGGNIGVLAGEEGVLLIDAEWPQLHDDVREYQGMLREVRKRVARAVDAGMSEEALIASHPLDDLDRNGAGT
jgi:hypothetical protein